jgi:hypothetical protein
MSRQQRRERNFKFRQKLFENGGKILQTCQELGIEWFNYVAIKRRDNDFKAILDDYKEFVLDELEMLIFERAKENTKLALKVLEKLRPEKWADPDKSVKDSQTETKDFLPRDYFYYTDQEHFKQLIKENLAEIDRQLKEIISETSDN